MDALFAERNRQHAERKAEQEVRSQEARDAVTQLESCLDAPFSREGAHALKEALNALEQFNSSALPQSLNRQAQQLRRRARKGSTACLNGSTGKLYSRPRKAFLK